MTTKVINSYTRIVVNIMQPFLYLGTIHIVIVDPFFVASIVRRVYVYTFYTSFIFGQKGFKSFKIITVDYLVFIIGRNIVCRFYTLAVGKCVLLVERAIWHIVVMIYHRIFSYPV